MYESFGYAQFDSAQIVIGCTNSNGINADAKWRAFLTILVEGGVIYLVYFLFSIAMILSQGAGTASLDVAFGVWTEP